ncbi:MAG: thiamine diphosphokinase [Thermoflexibacter sp.]
MSSHHIVRDAQEPALIIAGTHLPHENIGQLLEWSPVIVVTENCLEEVLTWDIKIDKIVCQDIHYQYVYAISLHQQPLEIWQVANVNPSDFVHLALQKLIQRGHEAVSIIWEDFTPKDFLPYIEKIELIVYHNYTKGYFVKKGVFKKWVTVGTVFYLPEKEIIQEVFNLEQIDAQAYKAPQTGLASFQTQQPIFLWERID